MSVFLDEALRLAKLGYPVFPCFPKTKKPANENGVSGASRDSDVITAWWRQNPRANIGLACHHCLIIDVDIKPEEGKRGDLDMPILVDALGKLPPSPMAKSGGGGWHLFFQRPKEEIVGRKAVEWQGRKTGIDIQVGNQYVVAPPSVHESEKLYEWITALVPVAELPGLPQKWIDDFLPKKEAIIPVVAQSPVVAWNDDRIIERCRQYVAAIPPAVMGQNGSAQTLCAANAIFGGFALSEEQGWPILMEYNARCQPPWTEKELVHKMRDAIEKPVNPVGWLLESKREVAYPEVDLSGLLKPQEDDEDEEEDDSLPKVEPVPNEYFRVPGFVGEIMDFCMQSAPYPVMGTAFCGAMALQAFLCSRKVREPGDLRPNLYLLALAGASGGKDQPRKINVHVMETIGMLHALADKIASGEGLLDSLFVQPAMLCQTDEIDGMIRAFNKPHNTNSETLFGTLLTLYSSSASSLPMRRKAGNTNPGVIVQPHFTLFGTATPKLYYKSLSEQLLTNGFFARTLILDIGKRPFGQDSIPVEQISPRVMETARWWQAFQPGEQRGNLAGFYPIPITVPMDENATKAFRDFRHWADLEFGKAEDHNDEVAKTVWGRANENAKKLALVYACSENHKDPKITHAAAKWAMTLCDHQVRRQLFLAQEFAVKNDFDAQFKEAIRILREWHAKHGRESLMPPWKFKNALGIRPREYDEVVSELQARHIAVYDSVSTGRRPKIGFRLLKPDA